MKIADINPHIRFAEQMTYHSKNITVYVKDCRLFYILSGDGKIHIDGKTFSLTADTLFYCSSGSVYAIEAYSPLCLYSLNFDLTQNHSDLKSVFPPLEFSKTKKYHPIEKHEITDSVFLNSYFISENCIKLKNTMSDIVEEFLLNKSFFRENCAAMLKKLLTELHRANMTDTGNSDTVKVITEYINSNFTKEISNSELSRLAGFHEYYLNRLFNKKMGISMHRYILILRLNEAKRLLLNTDISVSDIAYKSGFNSHTHFSSYFKKEMKMSPGQYRNDFKGKI